MYRQLSVDRTVATLQKLKRRIEERFPESGLASVGGELCEIAGETRTRVDRISRPHYPTRLLVGLFLLILIGIVWYSVTELIQFRQDEALSIDQLVSLIEAGSNELILAGAAFIFLFSIETRIKRTRALRVLHEFRAVAHVIDMHQLTKDPSRVMGASGRTTESSPERTMTAFQLTRYLNYGSELLALVGKLAALYAQSLPDHVVVGVVNEIESLTSGLSRKIWQKIILLDTEGLSSGDTGSVLKRPGSGSAVSESANPILW